MKICWDNIEGITMSKFGNLRRGLYTYIYMDSCNTCGESYLTLKYNPSNFCSNACAQTGKKDSKETLTKKSKAFIGKNNPMYGRKRSSRVKKLISKANYKGGFTANGLASYDTYNNQIDYAEKIRLKILKGVRYLEVKCTYCDKWYIPKAYEVRARKNSLEGNRNGESLFYCSNTCRINCPTYYRKKYQRGFKKATSREVASYVRKLCFERDLWKCQKCFSKEDLHCHHINSYSHNIMLSNDIDNCITLCKKCHKEVHKDFGCRYVDLHCKEEK